MTLRSRRQASAVRVACAVGPRGCTCRPMSPTSRLFRSLSNLSRFFSMNQPRQGSGALVRITVQVQHQREKPQLTWANRTFLAVRS
jgi:hypothetical protein